ncbi:hypothetical protein CFO_g3268 [Ceratocystis platani]|uniref:Uncharacterized protein n=1 Tax=Ceratocystis fimbriata f. sp. platani TaxID=88771 RepID=A0A0F8DEH5_CERFI|nr:hypothetical protein CFO_g3268 [Ceratocystis platani]
MNFIRILAHFEDLIVAHILRQPGFHRAVGKIQRSVDDLRYGRNPDEPLRPGEATEEQKAPIGTGPEGSAQQGGSFMTHFMQELRNQARGVPTPDEKQK